MHAPRLAKVDYSSLACVNTKTQFTLITAPFLGHASSGAASAVPDAWLAPASFSRFALSNAEPNSL